MHRFRHGLLALALAVLGTFGVLAQSAFAASARELSTSGQAALERLYANSEKARRYGRDARAILVFPKIVKAGLMVGGQSGEGVLFVGGKPVGYYKISAASYGFQAGAQRFSYALFFMTDSSLDYLRKSDGWAIGSGPSVVVLDEGAARNTNTTTLTNDVYAFPFGQKGLMAGLGLEGSKITPIDR